MRVLRLAPQTIKQWKRFRSIKRGFYSLIVMTIALVLSLFAELLVNNRALIVKYEGDYYFPTYAAFIPGRTFGLDYDYETNYRDLKRAFAENGSSNWVVLPPVPYNAYETDFRSDAFPPYRPSIDVTHQSTAFT